MSGLLRFCGLTLDARIPGTGPVGVPAVAVPAAVALLPLARFGHELLRARRVRDRHRVVLDLEWATSSPPPRLNFAPDSEGGEALRKAANTT
ncbi:hypothetical protein ABZ566_40590, partial [Streptomyces hygroscopicus]